MYTYNPSASSFVGVCGAISGILASISLLTWPLVAIIITRRFDPQFKFITKNEMGLGCFFRGFFYSLAAVIPKRWIRAYSIPGRVFKGYDLWAHATKFERTLACVHIIPLYLAMPGAIIFGIDDLVYHLLQLVH